MKNRMNGNNEVNERDESSKKKTIVAIILISLLLLLLITAISLGVTFARYKTDDANADKNLPVAKWGVTTDVSGALTTVDSANVVNGKIAPASQAYIDVKIKLDGTEVAVDYELTIGSITAEGAGTVPTGLAIEKVASRNADNTADVDTLTANAGKYTGTIALPSGNAFAANTEFIVRIYFKWTNNEANNAADTAIGNAPPTLKFALTVGAKQHITE